MPVGTAAHHALGRQSVYTGVFSSCWRGESARQHEENRCRVADPGRRRGQGSCSALGFSPSPTSWAGGNFQRIPKNFRLAMISVFSLVRCPSKKCPAPSRSTSSFGSATEG